MQNEKAQTLFNMNTKIKLLVKLLLLLMLTTLIGCSEEVYQNHEHSQSENKNKISLQQFKNETKIKDFKTFFKVPISANGVSNRIAELSEFVIDTIAIQRYVDQNNKTTYSFRIYTLASYAQTDEKYNLVYTEENNVWENSIIAFKERIGAQPTENQFEDFEKLYDSRMSNVTNSDPSEVCITESYAFHCRGCVDDCDLCYLCVDRTVSVTFCPNSGGSSPQNPIGNPINPGGNIPLNPFVFTPNMFDNPVFDDPNYINAVKAQLFFEHIGTNITGAQDWAIANSVSYNQIIQFQINNHWSDESETFADEMINLAKDEPDQVDVNKLINISILIENSGDNFFTDEFELSLDPYIDLDLANPPGDITIFVGVKIYLDYKRLRQLNPEWPRGKCFWAASKELVHMGLDAFGTIPVGGEIADLANGVLYTIDGDFSIYFLYNMMRLKYIVPC